MDMLYFLCSVCFHNTFVSSGSKLSQFLDFLPMINGWNGVIVSELDVRVYCCLLCKIGQFFPTRLHMYIVYSNLTCITTYELRILKLNVL